MNEPKQPVQIKVFLSSTHDDLQDYRDFLEGELRRIGVFGICMEIFGASDKGPTAVSLEQLERCNVYLGIIGHRFGSFSDDGRHSIVQREYQRAYELYQEGSMRLLIYLASDKVLIDPDLVGTDEQRQKQKRFRSELRMQHTPQTFDDKQDLLLKVFVDITNMAAQPLPQTRGLQFFEEGDWEVIKDKLDRSKDHFTRIEDFLQFLMRKLDTLFRFDPKHLHLHPLFSEARGQLQNIVPGVSLDDKEGILMRTGVRHLILRRETAVRLVQGVEKHRRRSLGQEIGRTAAVNLIENTIEKKLLIPASAEAFVTLLDYWDRTGGWGRLTVLRAKEDKRATARMPAAASAPPEWKIKIENNFLQVPGDLEKTHELCDFWCGYLQGILDEALPRITKLMSDHSADQAAAQVTLPAFSRVASVEHLNDSEESTDVFRIVFELEPLSRSQQMLSRARRKIKNGEYEDAGLYCREALRLAKQELGPLYASHCSKCGVPQELSARIKTMQNGGNLSDKDKSVVSQWFEDTSAFIAQLTKQKVQES